tara:strand:+ start:99 stop:554 length:456 start_codon:yes stop_codon:yes gene_type:complete
VACEFCEKAEGQFVGLSQGNIGREVFACRNCIANDEACGEFIALHTMLTTADEALFEESKSVQKEIIVKKGTKAAPKVAKKAPAKAKKAESAVVAKHSLSAEFVINKETDNCYRMAALDKSSDVFGSLYIRKEALPQGAVGAIVTVEFKEG